MQKKCAKNSFNLFVHKLNIVLCRRQRQTLNAYFSVNNENGFKFQNATKRLISEYGIMQKL